MPRPPKRNNTENEAEKTKQEQPCDQSEDIADFTNQAFKNVVAATRASNAFPQGPTRSLYLTYPGFARAMDNLSQRVVGLIGNVLHAKEVKDDIRKRALDEQFELVQECNDMIFERITTNLDIKSGLRRNPQQVVEAQVDVISSNSSSAEASTGSSSQAETPKAGSWNKTTPQRNTFSARLFTVKNIVRPQTQFKEPVDNSAQNPFCPRLKEKPNSLKPLALLAEYDEVGNIQSYLHPYEFELLKFEPPTEQLQKQKPILPSLMADTELMLVDTVEKLKVALEELSLAAQIAIDVEHHSYRTFMGITCLVQMSTRSKDYIFDTLTLRDEMHILNQVLTDPKKLKILHGADLDIEWLQRDLSLYIVNMFDTHRAAKALNMAKLSLAFLLKHYLDLDVDKSLQLADWRMRPLPQQLVDYARQDTHFLIYVYERMTNDLLQQQAEPGLLNTVYQMSTDVCKKRYSKPHIGPESHLDLVRKTKRSFDNRQLYALRGIFEWRDATARSEDESYGYVLPNHMMLQIAESLPREMQGILACCNPIPPLVRQHLHALHQIVLKARDQPLIKPISEARSSTQASLPPSTKDFGSKLYCPHDFSHQEEVRDDLPTLLKRSSVGKLQLVRQEVITKENLFVPPAMSLFDKPPKPTQEEELRWAHLRKESQMLRMPYKRYLAILPLMEKLKADQIARERSEQLKRRLCPTEPPPAQNIKLDAAPAVKEDVEDPIYSLPLKEQLKRKHAANRKPDSADQQPTTSKRARKDENTHPIKLEHADSATKPAESDDEVVETPIERQPAEEPKPPSRKEKRKEKRRQFQRRNRANHSQSSNQQVPQPKIKVQGGNFDYKNVDFRQFKGGAQRARGTEIKQQMRGKNRPNNRNIKQFNKLFTFSNVKPEGKK
ncbi:LOW QUALITY PROTEIN: exosome component 10 [Drosophila serrata]|uniref:LOW QUALITY PROTEIN: exosome component 10 n=1 Tax=Drosophila serrata TaxID=7274 RepID=UPI000A1D1092|nr:LOW QUALITY PROTEIN: exosome component 10 [Drosophila serrata]